MSRPVGSKNKNPYQDIKENQISNLGENLEMKEIKHVIRTIARSNTTTYGPQGQLVAMSMVETEQYLNQLIASGWQLFYAQMMNQNEATFDMLYILTKS